METEAILDRLGELYGELGELAADERQLRECRQRLESEATQLERQLRAARGLDKGGRPVGTRDPSSARGRIQALLDVEPGREWTVDDVQRALDVTHRQATGAVTALARENRIRRVRRGVYASLGTEPRSSKASVQSRIPWAQRRESCLAAINAEPGRVWTARVVVKEGLDHSPRRASIMLSDLTRDGKIRRVGRGFYGSLEGVARVPPKKRAVSPLEELRGRVTRGRDDLPDDTQEVIDALVQGRVVPR